MTLRELAAFLEEGYSPLPKREAFIQARRDNIISQTQLEDLIKLFDEPQAPAPEPKAPEEKFNLRELRLIYCPWSRKQWADMSSEEIDANIDAYDADTRAKALAYLRMRGFG